MRVVGGIAICDPRNRKDGTMTGGEHRDVIIHASFNMSLAEYRATIKAIRRAQRGEVSEVDDLELERLVTNLGKAVMS